MARNGNSNKGKKYVKLRGGEVATPENEARAREFLNWYAANIDTISRKLIYDHLYDDEVATDTMLGVYDCIALKGLVVRDYKFYFLRAYHTNYLAAQKRRNVAQVSIDAPLGVDGRCISDMLVAPDFNYEAYEETVDALKTEITNYVRDHYDPAACSLFEIYIALQPEMSYKKMARMLGFPATRVWPVIGAIRKDVLQRFAARKDYLLSCL